MSENAAIEAKFYEDPKVLVTRTRLVILGMTYAMANVTSVQVQTQREPVTTALIGTLLTIIGGVIVFGQYTACGGVMLMIGIPLLLWYILRKPKFWVYIRTSGIDTPAIYSHDILWSTRVVAAINEAIIARG